MLDALMLSLPDAERESWSNCILGPKTIRAQGLQNRGEPVRFDRLPVKLVRSGSRLGRYQTGPNSKFKFEFKKMKNSQKNPKNTSRCDESNGVKFSQKFVRLTYFSGI